MIRADVVLMRACLLAAYLAAPALLHAQTVDPRLMPLLTRSVGKTARIRVDSGNAVTIGAIERVGSDTLFLVPQSGIPQTLFVSRIARVDIREGLTADARLRRTRLGAVAGLVIGAAIGYEIAKQSVRHTERQDEPPLAQVGYYIDPLIGGVAGGAIGAASGNFWPGHWVMIIRRTGVEPHTRATTKGARLSAGARACGTGYRTRMPDVGRRLRSDTASATSCGRRQSRSPVAGAESRCRRRKPQPTAGT